MCVFLCGIIKSVLTTVFKIINIGFLLCGIAVLILAGLAKMKVTNIIPSEVAGVLSSTPIILLVTGIVICGIAFLGCCGFKRRSLICLIPYAVCLVVVIIAGLVVCIMLGTLTRKFEEHLETTMKEKFDTYKSSFDDKNFWDDMQKNAWCCGVKGPEDWKGDIPESCCTGDESDYTKGSDVCKSKSSEKKPYVYKKGCVEGVSKVFNKYWNIVMYTSLSVTLFSILAFVLACIIICDIACPDFCSAKN